MRQAGTARAFGMGALVSALLAGLALPASAEGLVLGGPKSRTEMFRTQTRVMDTRLAVQYSASARLRPDAKGGLDVLPLYTGNYRGVYLEQARAAARAEGVPEDLFLRLVARESNWNPDALSAKGARGLAQLMPDTADLLGVDISDPTANLQGGARYLRMMYDRFGTWRLALAAYNAGPQAVDAAGGVPDYDETISYVAAILG